MNKMCRIFCFLTVLLTIRGIYTVRFIRTVEAVGYPYFKILFSLGMCKDRILFTDYKIWGRVRLNRIFDIYYKADDGSSISRVEIRLVVNTTECISSSHTGVGRADFSAVLVLPRNVGIIFYSLTIFSCSPVKDTKHLEDSEEDTIEGYLESSELLLDLY